MDWAPASVVRWLFDSEQGASDRLISRWIFLRALGLIYFSAFFSLVFQISGLLTVCCSKLDSSRFSLPLRVSAQAGAQCAANTRQSLPSAMGVVPHLLRIGHREDS